MAAICDLPSVKEDGHWISSLSLGHLAIVLGLTVLFSSHALLRISQRKRSPSCLN